MIRCRGCNISYSPSCVVCPVCGTTTPFAPRRIYLEADAVRRVHAFDDPSAVVSDLRSNGFSDLEADEIVGRAIKEVRSESRRHGLRRFIIGMAAVVLGVPACLGPMQLEGAFMFVFGILACISGVVAAITGRAPPISFEP